MSSEYNADLLTQIPLMEKNMNRFFTEIENQKWYRQGLKELNSSNQTKQLIYYLKVCGNPVAFWVESQAM